MSTIIKMESRDNHVRALIKKLKLYNQEIQSLTSKVTSIIAQLDEVSRNTHKDILYVKENYVSKKFDNC